MPAFGDTLDGEKRDAFGIAEGPFAIRPEGLLPRELERKSPARIGTIDEVWPPQSTVSGGRPCLARGSVARAALVGMPAERRDACCFGHSLSNKGTSSNGAHQNRSRPANPGLPQLELLP